MAKVAMTRKTTTEGYDYIMMLVMIIMMMMIMVIIMVILLMNDGDDTDLVALMLMVYFKETEDNYEEINLKRGDGLKREDISEVTSWP